jgi:hypothetical protein
MFMHRALGGEGPLVPRTGRGWPRVSAPAYAYYACEGGFPGSMVADDQVPGKVLPTSAGPGPQQRIHIFGSTRPSNR